MYMYDPGYTDLVSRPEPIQSFAFGAISRGVTSTGLDIFVDWYTGRCASLLDIYGVLSKILMLTVCSCEAVHRHD